MILVFSNFFLICSFANLLNLFSEKSTHKVRDDYMQHINV